MTGETIAFDQRPGSENRLGYFVREPIGVVGAITPFNDPLNLVAHKVGPALAAGNAIIVKPDSKTPLSALKLAEAILSSGLLPRGVLQVITGRGSEIGDAMVEEALAAGATLLTGGKRRGTYYAPTVLENVPAMCNQPARMNIVASAKCYGGTFMLFSQRYEAERGVEVRWVRDPLDLGEWSSQIDDATRFVFGEMPGNPSLAVFDIAAVADLAHQRSIPLIVDATVATPALMRPLRHGADIVVHSVSKSMASSGFAIAGALIARHHLPSRVGPDGLRANFATYVKLLPFRDHGPSLSPFNALMALNDLRTLRSRMDFTSRNTLRVAEYLAAHPAVESVRLTAMASCSALLSQVERQLRGRCSTICK